MHNQLRTYIAILTVVLVAGCKNDKLPPPGDHYEVATSFGSWMSNLSSKNYQIGVSIKNSAYPERAVPESLLKSIVETATITNSEHAVTSPAVLSSNFDQQLIVDDFGEHREPAEIVFDGKALGATGWNNLHFKPEQNVGWNSFYSSAEVDAPLRLDSAPAIVTVEFHPENTTPTDDPTLVVIRLFFSEVVTSAEGGNLPSQVARITGPDGTMACTANGILPTMGLDIRCPDGIKGTITIEFTDETLKANGRALRAVDGSPFTLTVDPSTLPKHYAYVWFPTLPPY